LYKVADVWLLGGAVIVLEFLMALLLLMLAFFPFPLFTLRCLEKNHSLRELY